MKKLLKKTNKKKFKFQFGKKEMNFEKQNTQTKKMSFFLLEKETLF